MAKEYKKIYSRPYAIMPVMSGYCPGCLHSLATKIIAEAVEELGQQENAMHILPVGCSVWDFSTGEATWLCRTRQTPAVATESRCCPDGLYSRIRATATLRATGSLKLFPPLRAKTLQ